MYMENVKLNLKSTGAPAADDISELLSSATIVFLDEAGVLIQQWSDNKCTISWKGLCWHIKLLYIT